ncbi:MAG: sensor histidine kinase [Candidatus Methylomirabilia bacterium]
MHRAQQELQSLNDRLEEIVEERTAALTREIAEHTLAEKKLRGVLDDLTLAIAESGAVIERDPLPTVTADTAQMARLLMNLIVNALQFHGAAAPRVHVGAARLPGAWEISVRDNGIGIEPQHFAKIFLIYQRLHAVGEYPGNGTGPAVCKKIVERHGGAIRVESAPGAGSTFFFTIPDPQA